MDADRAERVSAAWTEQRLQLAGCRDDDRQQRAHARWRQCLLEQRPVIPDASQRHRRRTDVRHNTQDAPHGDVAMTPRFAGLTVAAMALCIGADGAAAQQTATLARTDRGAQMSSDSGTGRLAARVVGGAPRSYQVVSVAIPSELPA